MNLPVSVDDPSLLDHEPLRSRIATFECVEGQRSAAKQSVSEFVREMQHDRQAAAAAKKWAHLVFRGVVSDESSFELTDGGTALFKVFFKYQHLLHKARTEGKTDEAHQYEAHVHRNGIGIIKAIESKGHNSNAQHSTREQRGGQRSSRSSGSTKAHRQVETHTHHPDAGNVARSSSLGFGSHSSKGSPPMQRGLPFDQPPATDTRLSTLPEAGAAKPSKRSTSKKDKKRRASSQTPPIITPSDASEDDKEHPKACAVTAANSVFHRSKRIAPNPSRQPHELLKAKNQTTKTNPVYRAKPSKQHSKGDTSISQLQSSLIRSRFDDSASHSGVKGRRDTSLLFKSRKRNREKLLSTSTRAGSDSRKLVRDAQPRANKRIRRSSIPNLESEPGRGLESTRDLRADFIQVPTNQEPPVTVPPPTRENVHVESQVRSKHSRLEFETATVTSDDNPSATSHVSLGPDNRLTRALPRKVRDAPSVAAVRRVSCGTSSLEQVDQLLQDVASNALAMMPEGVRSDMPDWTRDNEHDVEYDDLYGDDQDDENDVQITTVTSVPPKAPVPASPRIWAQSRQEVCESFEYFRCYHGGVYSKDDIVKGYLLGAYAANRDIFHHDGKLIISHGGGKSESILDVRRGHRRYQMDQDQEASDKSVRALLKTWKDRRPVVLLADDKYALFPYDLSSAKYTYVVLGLYWISHAWAECQPARDGSGRIVRWKFAFQWCEGQGDPWWLPRQETTNITSDPPSSVSNSNSYPSKGLPHPTTAGGDLRIQCKRCQEHSPFVYKEGWMCLNPRCDLFWSINGEDPKQLDYCEEFLQLLPHRFERLPNIIPARVTDTSGGVTTTYAFSKGWHCGNCGRLSCRYKWEYWECSNCKFKHVVDGRIRSPKEFWHQRPPKGFLHSQIGKDSGILACRLQPMKLGTDKGFSNRLTFILPHGRGKIHLILGTPLSNKEADSIFQLYQQQAATGELQLRRYPLRNHRARGLLLTNYFSQNSGEPYQYVGGSGQTVPFCEAPDCVQRALALIKERATLALRTDIPFNEILSAAYMERQKMSFHSDSEKGLGPVVASLSLGSAALMHFRPHVNVDNLKAKSGHALTLVLRHGDVLIMDGDGVQKYYEHTVVPMNFRIAATARCIGTT